MLKKIIAAEFALVILTATGAFAQGHGAFLNSTAHSAQFLALSAQQSSTQTPAAEQPARIRVGGNVMAAKLAHQVLPIYPEIAKTAHISGTVVLHAIVGKDGSVRQLQFVSGPPLLMRSAMDAVRQWQYEPTLLNGEPVEVDTTVSVVFTLGGEPTPEPPLGTSSQPEIPATPTGPADYSQEPVLYEQVRGRMRYENDGTGMREVVARLRVQTPAGLAKAGQLIFDYNAANERIEIRTIHVVKPDGSVVSGRSECRSGFERARRAGSSDVHRCAPAARDRPWCRRRRYHRI